MIIGHDYIGVSAGAVITNKEGKFFLAQRGPQARDDVGTWEFPGGSVHVFETRESAVTRIIHEKYGVTILVDSRLGVYDVIDETVGDHWLSTTYLAHIIDGQPRIVHPTKCTAIGWFTLGELQKLKLSRITTLNVTSITKKR